MLSLSLRESLSLFLCFSVSLTDIDKGAIRLDASDGALNGGAGDELLEGLLRRARRLPPRRRRILSRRSLDGSRGRLGRRSRLSVAHGEGGDARGGEAGGCAERGGGRRQQQRRRAGAEAQEERPGQHVVQERKV